MKKFFITLTKIFLGIIGGVFIVIFTFWLCLHYEMNYKKTICDTSVSPDGKYEITLEAVGEPDWPFGSANGQLILRENENEISQTGFVLHNDGASISSSSWSVTWHEDYAEVVLSGKEQEDEQIILYFDGTK